MKPHALTRRKARFLHLTAPWWAILLLLGLGPATLVATPDSLGYSPATDDLIQTQQEIEAINDELESLQNARDLIDRALSAGNFIRKLDDLAWIEFPALLGDTISNVPIHIAFDHLRLYPDYAELAVVVQIKLPQRRIDGMGPVELYFGTPNLRISHDGGLVGAVTLGLYGNVPIGTGNPNKFAFILRGRPSTAATSGGTYVVIDCNGFVEMGVEADVLFSRDWIVPVDAQSEPLSSGRVQGRVQTVIDDWQNLLVELSLPHFAPTDYPDIAFHLSTAVFDFSDFRNSPGMMFPKGYAERELPPGCPGLWRGVFIKNLELSLPRQFRAKGCDEGPASPGGGDGGVGMLLLDGTGQYAYDTEPPTRGGHGQYEPPSPEPAALPAACRITLGVHNLLIDSRGLSGSVYAHDVLPMQQGSMDGWPFSIDSLAVELVTSRVTSFSFAGRLAIPLHQVGQSFTYGAFINIPDRSYSFDVGIGQDYIFPAFKLASVGILQGSYLRIGVRQRRFEALAVLYGYAEVRAKASSTGTDEMPQDTSKLSFRAARLNFHGLGVATRGVRLGLVPGGYLSLENNMSFMGIPLPIAEPRLTAMPGGRVRLSFYMNFNLMEPADNGFAVSTDVGVMAAFKDDDDDGHRWQNAGVSVGSIYVNIRMPSLKIRGYVHIFDDHPIYNRGFQGALAVEVGDSSKNAKLFSMELNAIFGRTDFRYWYVDGFLEMDAISITVVPGVLAINGFGGGAYYHMKMDGIDPSAVGQAGVTSSGVRYVPHQATTLGLKASVALRSPSTDVIDGVATLELAFAGIALQEIMFYGRAEIMCAPGGDLNELATKLSDQIGDRISDLHKARELINSEDTNATNAPDNQILATLFLRMNFEGGFEFQGTFRAQISAAQGAITGEGGVDILVSRPQQRWHLYLGGYTSNTIVASDGAVLPPIQVTLNLGEGITAGAGAYFLTGNDLPGPPPLHPAAAAFFGLTSATANNRASLAGSAAAGTGFAFGAFVFAHIDKRIRDGGNYDDNCIRADLGAGFDVSMLRYSASTYCSLSGHSPHGHKGWRATGRIWAYIEGRITYRRLPINLGTGILAEADLPKPTYLRLQIKFKFLRWDITKTLDVGEQCGTPFNP